jgi:predicted transcriptional regulator
MWQYLWFTCQNDLLNQKKDKTEYETTDRGFRFLKHYYRTIELLHVQNTEDPRRAPEA